MFPSVEGIYHEGRIELLEAPTDAEEGAQVIVTFIPSGSVDLASRGLDAEAARELRARLETFAEDWDSPEMAVYDHYDANKAAL